MNKTQQQILSADERDERLQYLKGLFRLSFRTNLGMAEAINDPASEFNGDDDDYDCVTEFAYDEPSGCGDDEDMAEFRADFQALDAEDVYLELCIDYYQDVLTELQQKQKLNQWAIITSSAYADMIPEKKRRHYAFTKTGVKVHDHKNLLKKPRYYSKRIKSIAERITVSEQHQKEIQAKITALQQELAQVKAATSKPNKLTKIVLQQTVALMTSPELTK